MRSGTGSRSLETDLHRFNINPDYERAKTLPRRLPSQDSRSSAHHSPSTRQNEDCYLQSGKERGGRDEAWNEDPRPLNYGDYLQNSYRGSARFKRKLNYSSRNFKNFTFYNL